MPPQINARSGRYMAEANIGPAFPPTVLVHGTEDTDVPYAASTRVAALLAENGVEHQMHTVRQCVNPRAA